MPVIIDARGLRCPLPVLRLARAAPAAPDLCELWTDDPAAEKDVPAFITERGWTLVAHWHARDKICWHVRRAIEDKR